MTPIVEQHSVEVELIDLLYDSPECKVYVVQTDVKMPVVFSTENKRLELVIYPATQECRLDVSAAPTRVLLHELGSRHHTTIVETIKHSTFVVSIVHPDHSKTIYEN